MHIRTRALWMLALLALASAPARRVDGAPVPGPRPSPTAAACPSLLLLESTTGRYYVAVFAAPAPVNVSFTLTLYSKTAAYAATIANVAIAKSLPGQTTQFRSPAQVIKNLDAGELLGASVATFGNCPRQDVIVPTVASLTAPDRTVASSVDALEQQLTAEVPGAPVTTPVPATGTLVPDCEDPFDDATSDNIVHPTLTKALRNNPDLGTLAILAGIDESGRVRSADVVASSGNADVDALGLAAARQSKFHPARFACKPIASTHLISTEFAR